MKNIFKKFISHTEVMSISKTIAKNPVVTMHILSPVKGKKFSHFVKCIIIPLYKIYIKKLFCKWKFIPSHMYIGREMEDQFVYEEIKK